MRSAIRPYAVIGFLVAVFFLRVLVFASQYGGMENDSGWLLGVAKNIARRGIYASYTNTVVEGKAGAFPSIHKRYSVQDADGFEYFPAAVSAGPGYQLPEAFILKLFGDGWWQYRAWPLISFAILLALVFYTVWKLGDYLALGLFSLWLWLIPQFYVEFAYEAYAESIAMMYFLAGCLLLDRFLGGKEKPAPVICSGILLALSFLTKTIFLLPIAGVAVFAVRDVARSSAGKRSAAKKWALFAFSLLAPVAIFYLYGYISVMRGFGIAGWRAVQQDYRMEFIQAGSGINLIGKIMHQNAQLFYGKSLVWMDVGSNLPVLCWLLFLALPVIFWRYLPPKEKALSLCLSAAAGISFCWYLFLSPDGSGRHIWQGLLLAMMLMCAAAGLIQKHYHSEAKQMMSIMTIGLVLVFANYQVFYPSLLLPRSVIADWAATRAIRGIQGFPPAPVFPLDDQEQLVRFFSQRIGGSDRIYYIAGFLNAEVATLTDKVTFPIARYTKEQTASGKAYLIVGAYEQGQYAMAPPAYVEWVKAELCGKVVFRNNSYMLCALKKKQAN